MNSIRLPAAGGALLVNGLVIAGLLSLAGPQALRQLSRTIEVALITPPAQVAAPEPEPAPPVVKPPEPLPIKKAAPRTPLKLTPEPRPEAAPITPAAPAPVVAARPVEEARPASITAEAAPAAAPVAPSVAAAPEPALLKADAPPPHIGPRIDASWSGNSPPPYPSLAKRMGEEGEVRLDVHVGAEGTVLDIKLKKSSGSSLLDQTAMDTVRRWRFKPATVDGKPVPEWYYNWRWVFKLES